MGVAGIGIAIFMALSLTISWISGDKARGSLEEKLSEGAAAQELLETDLKDARVKAASDSQILQELQSKFDALIVENKRLERMLDIEESQKRIAEQEGGGQAGEGQEGSGQEGSGQKSGGQEACSEKNCPDKQAFTQLKEKHKQDVVLLEAKLKAASDTKTLSDQNVRELETLRANYDKLSQQYAVANKEKQEALLTIGLLQVTVKERSKGQVTSLESRLSSLEQNRMGLESQLSNAMTAIVQLDETAARLESGLGTSAQPAEGMLKLQAEIESLRQAREKVRLAMENVKGSMQSNMASETIRMRSEINQLSGSLEQIASINKGAGANVTLMGQTNLQEEPMELKGLDETAVLNKKLQGLNLAIDDTFKETPQAQVERSAQAGMMEGGAPCAEVGAVKAAQETYTVVKGDSLWKIAAKKKIYSDPYLWPILYKYNLETVYHPDAIKPGYLLNIMRDLSKPEQEIAVKKARRHTKDRAEKGYILRLRRELTESASAK